MTHTEVLEKRVIALKESIATVSLQIEQLKYFYSSFQVRAWRKHKTNLNWKLKEAKYQLKKIRASNHVIPNQPSKRRRSNAAALDVFPGMFEANAF